jgi:branched-chain amino acid transport system substrate-binding protein
MAVDRYNRDHAPCTVALAQFDTKGQDAEAARLAEELIRDDKILAVVGPVWLTEALRTMPILDRGGVPAISPSVSYTGLSQRGRKGFHRTIGTDADQAVAGARYLTSVLGASKVYVVGDTDEYGAAVADDVRRGLGNAVAGRAAIRGDETDFGSVVSQVVAAGADAVYFAGYHDAAGIFVKQLRAVRPQIKVVAWDRVFTDAFVAGAGRTAAEGVVMTCPCVPPSEAGDNFVNGFRSR